jgi:hypothetical protein
MNYSLLPSYILAGSFAFGFIYRGIDLFIMPGLRDLFTNKTAAK